MKNKPLYCNNCNLLIHQVSCPKCEEDDLREVSESDAVFLISQDFIFSGVVEDVLRQNNIPFLKRRINAISFHFCGGNMMENFEFYVPYKAYEKARELINEIFSTEGCECDKIDEENDK